jgi:short-subunit dehydrogenase
VRLLRQLNTEDDIAAYADAYEKASGYRVPLEYLRRSLVFGFLRKQRLVGGVVMSGAPPFRTLQRIPEPQRTAVAAAIDPDDTNELVCVWLDRSLRGGIVSAIFWLGLFIETGRHGARFVLFGTESRGLYEMYLLGRPRVLYSGRVTVDGIERHGWIFHSPVSHRWSALRRIALHKLRRRRSSRGDAPAELTLEARRRATMPAAAGGAQASHAAAVPLRGLGVAAREIARAIASRVSQTGPRRAHAALAAAATDGGWALVTGASSGIGLAFAECLASRGAGLLLVADDEAVTSVADHLRRDMGVRTDALVADLSTREGVEAVVSWVADRRVEVLVNNAGIGVKGHFTLASANEYDRVIGVNILAPVLLTRALLPSIAARRRGAVVHVSSINALAPMPGSAVYSATKTFLLAYATAIWYEHRERGVVFQTLLPGTTATAFHSRQQTRVPTWALTATDVAESSIRALGRDLVHVPGALNRVFRTLGAILPLQARTAAAGAARTASLGTPSADASRREERIA